MRRVAFVFACSACASYGRRLVGSSWRVPNSQTSPGHQVFRNRLRRSSSAVSSDLNYPYVDDASFEAKYKASCFCKRIKFAVSEDPADARVSDLSVSMRLHGAAEKWEVLFPKSVVAFEEESMASLRWYNMEKDEVCMEVSKRTLPSRVQCNHCGTWIGDEGEDMFTISPTLFEVVNGGDRPKFPASFMPSRRASCATGAAECHENFNDFKYDGKTPLSTSDYLKAIAPRLDGRSHKGAAGRICVFGGSIDFAGAPFYAGMAALRVGAELLYLCTALEATGPIKSYSPELMVSEVYRWSHISSDDSERVAQEQQRMYEKMEALLPRLHAMTIGPGLGRDDRVLHGVKLVIQACNRKNIPLVIDADALWLIERAPEILEGYTNAVLTPNAAELRRLAKALTGNENCNPQEVCNKLKGPILLQKGPIDRIFSPGKDPLECDDEGAPRRPGGLGDFLAGSLAVFLGWAKEAGQDNQYACKAACTVVRRACKKAYLKKKRAMVAPDVLDEVGEAFDELCPALVSKM